MDLTVWTVQGHFYDRGEGLAVAEHQSKLCSLLGWLWYFLWWLGVPQQWRGQGSMPVAGWGTNECISDAVPSTTHLLFKHCQLKLSQKTRTALKTTKKFQVFWKCWSYLIVFLVSIPISHSQDSFSICSLQGRSLEMYFFLKKKWKLSLSHQTARAGGCENKAELTLKLQEWAKGLLKRAASLSGEWGWMERKARRAERVSRFGFPGTIGERQCSLPAPAETKSPYTTKAKSAFLFVCILWGLGGQVAFDSCIPTKTPSPLSPSWIQRQEEIQAVIEEQGPYKLHKRAHTPPLSIVYIKHNLKTVIIFSTCRSDSQVFDTSSCQEMGVQLWLYLSEETATFKQSNCIWMICGRLYTSFNKES